MTRPATPALPRSWHIVWTLAIVGVAVGLRIILAPTTGFMRFHMTDLAGGLVLLQPQLAESAAQYRIESAPAAAKIAKVFGYDGLMFAWTSAANGAPFGCCDGRGGFENCIEQHVTPDVAFFFQQLFRATGNTTWLRKAWPVIEGVAEWIVTRVTHGT